MTSAGATNLELNPMKNSTILRLVSRLQEVSNAIHDESVLLSRGHQYSIDFVISELTREVQLQEAKARRLTSLNGLNVSIRNPGSTLIPLGLKGK